MEFKIKHITLIFYLILFSYPVKSQLFSKKYSSSILNTLSHIEALDNEILILTTPLSTTGAPLKGAVISKLNLDGEILWSRNFPNLNFKDQINLIGGEYKLIRPIIALDNGDFLISSNFISATERKYFITSLSSEGNINWSKLVSHNTNTLQPPRLFPINNNYFLSINSINTNPSTNIITLQKFDTNGELLLEKQIIDNNYIGGSDKIKYGVIDSERIAIIKYSSLNNLTHVSFYTEELNYIESFEVDLFVKEIIFENGEYFVSGEMLPYSDFNARPALCKLNDEYKIEWSVSFDTNVFTENYSLAILQDKIYFKTYLGAKSILLQLSKSGIIESGKTINLNNILVSSGFIKVENLGFVNIERGEDLVILSTMSRDLETYCYRPFYCNDPIDAQLQTNESQNIYDSYDLEITISDFIIEMEVNNTEFEDACIPSSTLNIPIPYFTIPDTICVNERVVLSDIQNIGASSVNWDLTGSSFSNSTENIPPSFFYSNPGTYVISQTVNVNGCENTYSAEIVVVPPIDVSPQIDTLLCIPSEIILDAGNELADNYLWLIDSSTNSTFVAQDTGVYTIEINNFYCTSSTDYHIRYLEPDLLSVDLGSDTIVCEQVSYTLEPIISDEATYTWTDNFPALNRNIIESGLYTLSLSIDQCSSHESIFIQVEDCSTQIYLPNAFSPNNDGFNDTFFPLGNYFEVLEFQIFDRWGNLVHNGLNPWDGKYREKKSSIGVYNYIIITKNLLTDQDEIQKGNLSLFR